MPRAGLLLPPGAGLSEHCGHCGMGGKKEAEPHPRKGPRRCEVPSLSGLFLLGGDEHLGPAEELASPPRWHLLSRAAKVDVLARGGLSGKDKTWSAWLKALSTQHRNCHRTNLPNSYTRHHLGLFCPCCHGAGGTAARCCPSKPKSGVQQPNPRREAQARGITCHPGGWKSSLKSPF